MAKTIKRVGIIFFVLVVSLLVAVGSVFAVNVTSNGDMLLADTSAANGSNGSDIDSNQYSSEKADIPNADGEYFLTCDCPDGEPCICGEMERIWEMAIDESLNTGKNIKVKLGRDWIARFINDGENAIFGSSSRWSHGRITISYDVEITFDLNGYTIDRRLNEDMPVSTLDTGSVFISYGTLNLLDSSYDSESINMKYHELKSDKDALNDYFNNLKIGKIKGAYKESTNGGSIYTDGILNMYGGMICEGYGTLAGGIFADKNSTLNFYDGIIANNTGAKCGGIYSAGDCNIYGGIIFNNTQLEEEGEYTDIHGGGLCHNNRNTELNIYDGIFAYNTAVRGGGVFVLDASSTNIFGGSYEYNHAKLNGGGIYFLRSILDTNMRGGVVSNNRADGYAGGVFVNRGVAGFNLYDAVISFNSAQYTGGLHTEETINLYGGAIFQNEANSLAGGIYNQSLEEKDTDMKGFNIYGGIQIYDNKLNGNPSDMCLSKDQKIYFKNLLKFHNQIVHIGISVESDYGDVHFTDTTAIYPSSATMQLYCFSNDSNKHIETIDVTGEDGEKYKEGILKDGASTADKVVWSWGEDESFKTEKNYIELPYTGTPYEITALVNGTNVKIRNWLDSTSTSHTIKDAGQYIFYTQNTNYFNASFTIKILPVQVSIEWNTEVTYNGNYQSATAKLLGVLEQEECYPVVKGAGLNVGTYVCSVSELQGADSKNYKLVGSSTKVFTITKAKLNKPFGTASYEYGKSEPFIPTGFDSNLMDITGNNQSEVGSYEATISLKDKLNYEWADGGNEDIKLQYAITLAPVVEEDNSVYKFIYLDTEDNTRKTYAEGDLKHGLNDSNVNIKDGSAHYVLGNILPETSVKEFVQTLNYDTAKLKVFNNKGQEVSLTDEVTVVGSGWYIEYTPVAGGAKDTIYLSVLGDVTGDGRIDATDITYLRRIANGEIDKEALNPAILLAAMVDNRGKITSVDAEILRAICKYETVINKYF